MCREPGATYGLYGCSWRITKGGAAATGLSQRHLVAQPIECMLCENGCKMLQAAKPILPAGMHGEASHLTCHLIIWHNDHMQAAHSSCLPVQPCWFQTAPNPHRGVT